MTTSGTTDFDLSIDDVVEEAFERCGMRMTSGYQLTSARRSLNLVFLDWANRGLNLWTIEQQTYCFDRWSGGHYAGCRHGERAFCCYSGHVPGAADGHYD
jgi:hypothetical protein